DVGVGAEPFANLSVGAEQRYSSAQPPLVHAISAPQTTLERIGFTMLYRALPRIPRALPIVGMERCDPAAAVAFLEGETGVVHPLLNEVDVPPVGSGGPDDLRHRLGQLAKLAFTVFQSGLSSGPVGDVLCLNDVIERCTLTSAKNRRAELDIDDRPVLA